MALGRLSAGGGRHQSCSNCSEVIRNSTRAPQRAACSLKRLLQADRRALCVAHAERALESAGLPRMPPSSSLDSLWLAHCRQRSITTGGSNSSDNAAAALPEPSEPQCSRSKLTPGAVGTTDNLAEVRGSRCNTAALPTCIDPSGAAPMVHRRGGSCSRRGSSAEARYQE